MADHGTYAGYNQHRRHGEQPCDPCRAAQRIYIKQWRTKTGDTNNRARASLRSRALTELARRHPAEFRRLLFEMEQSKITKPQGETT